MPPRETLTLCCPMCWCVMDDCSSGHGAVNFMSSRMENGDFVMFSSFQETLLIVCVVLWGCVLKYDHGLTTCGLVTVLVID